MRTLRELLAGTGRRRSQDHAASVEADRNRLRARLAECDSLLAELWCHAAAAETKAARVFEERSLLADAILQLLADHAATIDTLTAVQAENANLRAVSSPAPADQPPALSAVQAVTTLWDAHGLRPAA